MLRNDCRRDIAALQTIDGGFRLILRIAAPICALSAYVCKWKPVFCVVVSYLDWKAAETNARRLNLLPVATQ